MIEGEFSAWQPLIKLSVRRGIIEWRCRSFSLFGSRFFFFVDKGLESDAYACLRNGEREGEEEKKKEERTQASKTTMPTVGLILISLRIREQHVLERIFSNRARARASLQVNCEP